MRKKKIILLLISFLLFIVVLSHFQNDPSFNYQNQTKNETPQLSGGLEGAENILIVEIIRNTTISSYGLVNIDDRITILNQNDNPINSILIGIPLNDSNNLIYFSATGQTKNTLLIERSHEVMHSYEMITIYFDSPLLPSQEIIINILQTYQNLVTYKFTIIDESITQLINFTGPLFPILPYMSEGNIKSNYRLPEGTTLNFHKEIEGMGMPDEDDINVLYDLEQSSTLNFLDPFLANLDENNETTITFEDKLSTKLEIEEINREIYISPWGVVKIKEEVKIVNLGIIAIPSFSINLPVDIKNIHIYDDLGELLGVTITDSIEGPSRKVLTIALYENRVSLEPSSKFNFFIEYNLPYETLVSYNWLQQSILIDIFTTSYDFLIHQQTTNIIIEGCSNIDYMSSLPEAMFKTAGTRVLVYNSENVSPLERKTILFTFTVDIFDLILRPVIFMLIIAFLSSVFVLIIKTQEREEQLSVFKKEFIPTNEIREFCSLYEERNALILEIRKAENEAKRKKLAKKTYKNLLAKNTTKIDQIKDEITPFKKVLMETNETFNNIVKKLDVLDAERFSVNDSLTLLETRYKRGRLPSKAAYQKLSDDFFNRRKKLDRTIDKYIQQLRSYLL
ncbi:hypothetical protein ES703_89660 [subsurface metagenome]